jgi:hypothetical protein
MGVAEAGERFHRLVVPYGVEGQVASKDSRGTALPLRVAARGGAAPSFGSAELSSPTTDPGSATDVTGAWRSRTERGVRRDQQVAETAGRGTRLVATATEPWREACAIAAILGAPIGRPRCPRPPGGPRPAPGTRAIKPTGTRSNDHFRDGRSPGGAQDSPSQRVRTPSATLRVSRNHSNAAWLVLPRGCLGLHP